MTEPTTQAAHSGTCPGDCSAPQYRIGHVRDFLAVPEDRLSDCLTEFADFLGLARDTLEMVKTIGEIVGEDAGGEVGAFTWVDDGARNKTVRLHVQNAEGRAQGKPDPKKED